MPGETAEADKASTDVESEIAKAPPDTESKVAEAPPDAESKATTFSVCETVDKASAFEDWGDLGRCEAESEDALLKIDAHEPGDSSESESGDDGEQASAQQSSSSTAGEATRSTDKEFKIDERRPSCTKVQPLVVGPDLSCLPEIHGSHRWIRVENSSHSRRLRQSAALQTKVACQRGYVLQDHGRQHVVTLEHVDEMRRGTMFVQTRHLGKDAFAQSDATKTEICTLDGSTMNVAVQNAISGARVVAINAASAYHAGGGFEKGGRHALEESMCMQSSLFESLEFAIQLARRERLRPSKLAIRNWVERHERRSASKRSVQEAIQVGSSCTIIGFTQMPQLNGSNCTIDAWDPTTQKWVAEIFGGGKMLLQSENLCVASDRTLIKEMPEGDAVQDESHQREVAGQLSSSEAAKFVVSAVGDDVTDGKPNVEPSESSPNVVAKGTKIPNDRVKHIPSTGSFKCEGDTVEEKVASTESKSDGCVKEDQHNGDHAIITRTKSSEAAAERDPKTTSMHAPQNKQIVAGAEMTVTGLVQKPEMNGTLCTVISWDEGAQKWVVQLSGGAKARLSSDNLTGQCKVKRKISQGTLLGQDIAAGPIAKHLLRDRGIRPARRHRIPRLECHIPEDGALLSPVVEVFRGPSSIGYPFQRTPICLAGVVSVAMPNCNFECRDSPVDRPNNDGEYEMLLRTKCVALFAAAKIMDAEVVVVPTIGCGVFKNDPQLIGRILGDVLCTDFRNAFRKVLVMDRTQFGGGVLSAAQPHEPPQAALETPNGARAGQESAIVRGSRAVVFGITVHPELNGTLCKIISWDAAASKWRAELNNGKIALLADANLRLEAA